MAILLNEQHWTSCFNCSRKYEATTAKEYQKFSIWGESWEKRKVTNTLGDSEWRATKGNINSLHKIILHQCPHSKKNTLKGEKCQSSLASDNCYSWRLPAPNWREKPMESKPRSVHLKKKSRSRHGWLNSRGDAFLRMRFSTVWEWKIWETQPWGKGLWVWVLPISFSLDDMRMRSETQLWPELEWSRWNMLRPCFLIKSYLPGSDFTNVYTTWGEGASPALPSLVSLSPLKRTRGGIWAHRAYPKPQGKIIIKLYMSYLTSHCTLSNRAPSCERTKKCRLQHKEYSRKPEEGIVNSENMRAVATFGSYSHSYSKF